MSTLTPLDGRYSAKVAKLASLMGDEALLRRRIETECAYFVALSRLGLLRLSAREQAFISDAASVISAEDIKTVKSIELGGHKIIKATKHDVKAVEYYLKEKFEKTTLKDRTQWLHFALTSEDINSISYALMARDAVEQVLLPSLEEIQKNLLKSAKANADTVMLARTHGQPAVPTTFGKEFKVFHYRLARQIAQLKKQEISCKLGGAVGNFNAHTAAFPQVNWSKFAKDFVASFNKGHKTKIILFEVTDQNDPHDTLAELFDNIRRINIILTDLSQDMWRYISDGLVKQKAAEGEVGSSTMPQKINPIDFENAEGNLGLANALLGFFSQKLPVSRLQRDLSDSTVLRNIGAAFGYSEVAYRSLIKGLGKSGVDAAACRQMLLAHPEVIAEALQTILRAHGVKDGYEQLKDFTRGKALSAEDIKAFIDGLKVSPQLKTLLYKQDLLKYTGTAAKTARKA